MRRSAWSRPGSSRSYWTNPCDASAAFAGPCQQALPGRLCGFPAGAGRAALGVLRRPNASSSTRAVMSAPSSACTRPWVAAGSLRRCKQVIPADVREHHAGAHRLGRPAHRTVARQCERHHRLPGLRSMSDQEQPAGQPKTSQPTTNEPAATSVKKGIGLICAGDPAQPHLVPVRRPLHAVHLVRRGYRATSSVWRRKSPAW